MLVGRSRGILDEPEHVEGPRESGRAVERIKEAPCARPYLRLQGLRRHGRARDEFEDQTSRPGNVLSTRARSGRGRRLVLWTRWPGDCKQLGRAAGDPQYEALPAALSRYSRSSNPPETVRPSHHTLPERDLCDCILDRRGRRSSTAPGFEITASEVTTAVTGCPKTSTWTCPPGRSRSAGTNGEILPGVSA